MQKVTGLKRPSVALVAAAVYAIAAVVLAAKYVADFYSASPDSDLIVSEFWILMAATLKRPRG
jgi:hypothetical protein